MINAVQFSGGATAAFPSFLVRLCECGTTSSRERTLNESTKLIRRRFVLVLSAKLTEPLKGHVTGINFCNSIVAKTLNNSIIWC
jgi:hypothetical protein